MGIQKPFLEEFSADELMQFVDHYAETDDILHIPGHSWDVCDQLARFLGFGYDRTWSSDETDILTQHYPQLGADETAKLLPLRSPTDCDKKAYNLGLHTFVKRPCLKTKVADWMSWELDILYKYYPIIGNKTAIFLPDRSETACTSRASRENITLVKPVQWTDKELDIIRKYYPKIGPDIENILPGKSRQRIIFKAGMMGLSAPSQEWTPQEDELLKLHYPQMGADVSQFFMGRRSRISCATRARSLGIACEKDRQTWSEDELAILDANYPILGPQTSELLPGRTEKSCKKMARSRHLIYQGAKRKKVETWKKWSLEEIEILQSSFPEVGKDVYKLLPNRSKVACMNMAASLGLCKGKKTWSDEEDNILMENYATMGTDVASLLPGRTKSACQNRAQILNLHREKNEWTAEEEAILKEFYPKEGAAAFRRLPNRSEASCRTRLTLLGIYMRRASDGLTSNNPD